MGSPGSGGTASAGKTAAYIPQQQPAADQGYQNLTSTLYNQGAAGLNTIGSTPPAAQAWPYVQGTTSNVLNNPYQGQYVQGGQNALDYFQGGVMPNINQGAQQLAGLGNMAANAGQNPAYAAAQGAGNNMTGGFQGAVGQLLGDIFNPQYRNAIGAGNIAAGKQFGAGDAIRTAAFDPQNALYNRTYSRLSDQIGAGNANSGLAGTPYGESVRGNTLGNFNIDWQNNLLQRMMQGGASASGLDTAGINDMLNPATAATSAAATDISGAGSGLSSALSALLTPANAQTNAMSVATGAANTGFQGANSLLTGGASGLNSFSGLPYSNYQTTQGNNFGALQNEISLGNQNYALPQQVLNDLQSYLNLGQSASGLANTIGTTNFNQLAQGVGGAANLLGGPLGFGGSGGGALGGLIGSAGSGITDFGGGGAALGIPDVIGGEAATSGSGILGALSSLGPAAISA